MTDAQVWLVVALGIIVAVVLILTGAYLFEDPGNDYYEGQ